MTNSANVPSGDVDLSILSLEDIAGLGEGVFQDPASRRVIAARVATEDQIPLCLTSEERSPVRVVEAVLARLAIHNQANR